MYSLEMTFGFVGTSGGTVEEVSTGLYRYRANISSHLQDMINGTIENKGVFYPYPRRRVPAYDRLVPIIRLTR